MNPVAAAGTEGFANFEDVCVGGQTLDGRDATNDSHLPHPRIDACAALTCPDTVRPDPRQHARQPFCITSWKSSRTARDIPKLLNDEMVIPFYLANGATAEGGPGLEHLRVLREPTAQPGNERHRQRRHQLRFGRRDDIPQRQTQGLQGPSVRGADRRSADLDELSTRSGRRSARRLEHLARHALIQQHVAYADQAAVLRRAGNVHAPRPGDDRVPRPAHARRLLPGRASTTALFEAIGKGTAIDSLAAVKHLIFDTKRLTWDQLLTAIEANWEGHEAIRQMCLNAPKYGNGIEWVDAIGFEIETLRAGVPAPAPQAPRPAFLMRQIPITFHVPMGKVTWATPNGRPAHEYLSEGISASHGMDVKGPDGVARFHGSGPESELSGKGGRPDQHEVQPGLPSRVKRARDA